MSARITQFSHCRRYRYTLWREWDQMVIHEMTSRGGVDRSHEYLMVIGLNPSTADETNNDPTIRRCIDFAQQWGFGALCMTNLFAWRDTKPEGMRSSLNPVGPFNDHWLTEIAETAGMILAACGKHGSFRNRHANVSAMFQNRLYCLRRNKDGSPQHPLYVPANTQPVLLFR